MLYGKCSIQQALFKVYNEAFLNPKCFALGELHSATGIVGHVASNYVTSSKLKVKQTLQQSSMAVLAGCRVLFQGFRSQANSFDGVCRLHDAVNHAVGNKIQYVRLATHGGIRQYSSDSKSGDDLIVRYLDGDDAGRF